MNTAMDRSKVSLSGSNTLEEWILKKRGVATTAASQPASIIPPQYRESLLSNGHLSLPEMSPRMLPQGMVGRNNLNTFACEQLPVEPVDISHHLSVAVFFDSISTILAHLSGQR